jgi:two-component system sensor histidine kinase VicK
MKSQTEKDLKDARIAAQNVLEDFQVERERLAQAKAKDEALLASIGDGVVATDQDGRIILMNQAAERMLGWQASQLMGKLLAEAWTVLDEEGKQIPKTEQPITSALLGMAATISPVYLYVRKDGTIFPVSTTVTPVIVDNKIIGAIDIFRDITRERAIDHAKTEFVSLASHQLKTPPTAIKLLLERILNGKAGPLTEKQKEYFNDIQSSNQRMIDIVDALLSVSRIEMGTFAIEPSDKDICALVQDVLDELKMVIYSKKMQLELTFPKTSVMVSIDEPLFRMVMNNLVMNAVNYTQEGGKILVSGEQVKKSKLWGGKMLQEDSFVVSVADTGCGIPKSQQSNLFTKFFRADNAREKHPNGTGLGLYIIKSILDTVGGSIWFLSKENKGTTFYVAIPMTGMKIKMDKKNP